jgi:hypothetical protein
MLEKQVFSFEKDVFFGTNARSERIEEKRIKKESWK